MENVAKRLHNVVSVIHAKMMAFVKTLVPDSTVHVRPNTLESVANMSIGLVLKRIDAKMVALVWTKVTVALNVFVHKALLDKTVKRTLSIACRPRVRHQPPALI